MTRSRTFALAAAAMLMPLSLGGCHSGTNSDVFNQGTSGDGTQVVEEGVQVDGATLVAGDEGSGNAAFLGTVLNTAAAPDELLQITAGGVTAELSPRTIPLPPGQGVPVQTGRPADAQFTGLEAATGTYVDVTMQFRSGGTAQFQALLVPPAGFYAAAAPAGTTPVPEKVNEATEHEVAEDEVAEHDVAEE